MVKKAPALDYTDLYSAFETSIEESLQTSDETLDIIRFVEEEVDLGITLTIQQKCVLKSFYNLDLTEDEHSIFQFWKSIGKTTWDASQTYQSLILESGRRSGKSSMAAIIAAYEFYMLCKMPSPQAHYGIATSTPISILVLATTATQAKKTIFKTVVGVVRNTRYFQKLEAKKKLFIGTEEIKYDDKLLYIYSGNSQSGSQVGGTMKAMIMDEVARFKDSDGESNALELWSNLGIATTTFGKDARRIAISSAWFEGDAIEKLYEATDSDPTGLGIRTASWDMNPIHAARDNPIVVSEYATDPVKAALEFEGVRPAAEDAFLDANEVKRAFTGLAEIKYEPYQEDEAGYLLEKIRITECERRPAGTVLHIDPAITKDSYAMAFGHNEFDDKGRQIVRITGLLAWEPQHNTQVSITDVQKAIIEINKYRPLEKVTADHYNSAETIQRLRQLGIKSDVQHYSNRMQVSMYDLVRMLLHEKRLILPKDSPLTTKLTSELCRVQLIRGQKIDHPKGNEHGKDLADAVASVCYELAGRLSKDRLGRVGATTTSFVANRSPAVAYSDLTVGGRTYSQSQSTAKQKILGNLHGRSKWINRRR